MPSVFRSTAERRPPSPLLTARLARASSRSTASPSTSSSPKLSSSNSRSLPSSSAKVRYLFSIIIEESTFLYKKTKIKINLERFAGIDIRVRVKGGGRVAQVYAIRQAVSRAVVAYYQKYVDEQSKQEIKVCSRQRLQLEGYLLPQSVSFCQIKFLGISAAEG